LYIDAATRQWFVVRSTDTGAAAPVSTGVSAPAATVWFNLDADGDGLSDLGYRDGNNGNRLRYLFHAAPAAPAEVLAPEPPPTPKPTYGAFGFDTAGMNQTVLPGDNFYQYANGTWAKNTPIPADKSNYGMFTRLDDISRQRTRAIKLPAADSAAGRYRGNCGSASRARIAPP